jgi:hypothetical protein
MHSFFLNHVKENHPKQGNLHFFVCCCDINRVKETLLWLECVSQITEARTHARSESELWECPPNYFLGCHLTMSKKNSICALPIAMFRVNKQILTFVGSGVGVDWIPPHPNQAGFMIITHFLLDLISNPALLFFL